MCWRVTHATQVRIIEDQQAAKRRDHDKQQRAKNMELMQHVKLLRSDLQQQVSGCTRVPYSNSTSLCLAHFILIVEMQWKQKHQALMLERERVNAAKAADLKVKVESSRLEAKELKHTFKEHFDSAAVMMRVVASTFAKLAAVENAREKNLQQSEMEVSDVLPVLRRVADAGAGSGTGAAIKFPELQEHSIQVKMIVKEAACY